MGHTLVANQRQDHILKIFCFVFIGQPMGLKDFLVLFLDRAFGFGQSHIFFEYGRSLLLRRRNKVGHLHTPAMLPLPDRRFKLSQRVE